MVEIFKAFFKLERPLNKGILIKLENNLKTILFIIQMRLKVALLL